MITHRPETEHRPEQQVDEVKLPLTNTITQSFEKQNEQAPQLSDNQNVQA